MQPLQITAHLATPFVAYDCWSPSLDNLLIWLLLDRAGKSVSYPTPETARLNQPFILENLALSIGYLEDEWYHQVSSPQYSYTFEFINKTHKVWNQQEQHLDWQGRRQKWQTDGFHTKSRINLLPERSAPRIDWFCVGDLKGISDLLKNCHNLGKQRRGQVVRWEIQETKHDLHLWNNGRLMRPVPIHLMPELQATCIMKWGWRSPVFLPENIADCAMPKDNTRKQSSQIDFFEQVDYL